MLVTGVVLVLLVAASKGNNFACEDNKFPCLDDFCIDKNKWCDNELDCENGIDEQYCSLSSNIRPDPNNCSEIFFRCKDGPCIPLIGRCDGQISCFDHSDEDGCEDVNHIKNWNSTETSTYNPNTESGTTKAATTFSVGTHPTRSGVSVPSSERTDSIIYNATDIKHENVESDFVELNVSHFKDAKIKAQHWLLKMRSQNYGWNEETARAFTALYLSEDNLEPNISEKSCMAKELYLKLLAALLRNESISIPLVDLSLYMNALTASCVNTENFYGYNLIHTLRQRTDLLQGSMAISPLIYITLCINDATTYADIVEIKEIVHKALNEDRVGVLALASLAATCISRTSKFSNYSLGKQVSRHLYSIVAKQGLPENIYELALVTQALNEARVNQELWNRTEALKRIMNEQDSDGSFGNILSTYYAIPVLSGKSLLSVKQCSAKLPDSLTALDVQDEGDRKIKYSLYFGHPVVTSIGLIVPVKNTSNLFDIMRKAATMNPSYEFRYSMNKGKPIVYSIGGLANDPEQGMYWKLYTIGGQHSSLHPVFKTYEDDVRLFIPAAGEEIVYWWKSIY